MSTPHQFVSDVIGQIEASLHNLKAHQDNLSSFEEALHALDQDLKQARIVVVRRLLTILNRHNVPQGDEHILEDHDDPCHCCHCEERRRRMNDEASIAAVFYGLDTHA